MTEAGAAEREQQWRAAVERALAGAPFESLIARTLDCIPIAPLYTERDRPAEEGVPWLPRTERRMGAVRDARVLGALDEERRGGATLVWVCDGGERIAEMRPEVPEGGLELLLEPTHDRDRVLRFLSPSVRAAIVPFVVGVPEDVALLDALAGALGRGAAALGATGWQTRWATSAVDELAIAIASFVASLRALEARGVPLERVVLGATVTTTIGTDLFLEIAKLRALRRLIARVLDAAGISERPTIAARTSSRFLSALDRPTNILRSTLAASAALIGGADAIAVRPHDDLREASPGGSRLARNTPLVLALESHLDAPSDPAGGSYFVEHLTHALTRGAWTFVREIESLGGLVRAAGVVTERLAKSDAARRQAVATRRVPLVGASRFPTTDAIGDPAADGERDARPFEALRQRGAALSASAIVLPGCPEARVDFARDVVSIACPRVSIARVDGDPAAALGDASCVILCAADADLASALPDVARALRHAGAKAIAVAGRPGAHEQALRAAGVDAFAYVGADVVAALGTLLDAAEAR